MASTSLLPANQMPSPPGTTALDLLCKLFSCRPERLAQRLAHPHDRQTAVNYLKALKLRTDYKKTKERVLRLAGITDDNSDSLPAKEGVLGITVRQLFLAKYDIYLNYWYLPCLYTTCHKGRHRFYYPLELVVLM